LPESVIALNSLRVMRADVSTAAMPCLCTFEVDAVDADAVAWEPIWHDGTVVGYVTSGGYSHHAQKSIAFGFLPVELVEEGREVEIEILGDNSHYLK